MSHGDDAGRRVQRNRGNEIRVNAVRSSILIELRDFPFAHDHPARTPWVGPTDVTAKGAVILWPTTGTAGTPPPDIKARFPQLVPEVPRAFERPVQGRLPLMRIGWGVLRPQEAH